MTVLLCGSSQTHLGTSMPSGGGHIINPYSFVAVQQIAKWLHPDLFADLDPEAALKELHERFLPVDYRPGYWVSLD